MTKAHNKITQIKILKNIIKNQNIVTVKLQQSKRACRKIIKLTFNKDKG